MVAPISVVIPCYNAATWIRETVLSVLAQSQPPLEIILVDDGSTDGSGDIVAREFPQVKIIQVPNGGVSRARNIGWNTAKGEWIQFLDADDLIHPQKLEWQSPYLASQSQEVAFVFSPWQTWELQNEQWRATGSLRSSLLVKDLYCHVLDEFTHLSAGLVRRTWLEQIQGFDEAKPPIEDVDLQLRLVHAGAQFAFLSTAEAVYLYRQLSHSLSTRSRTRFMQICLANVEMTEQFIREENQLTKDKKQLLARHYLTIARYYAEHNLAVFGKIVDMIEQLVPNYVPESPKMLAVTSRLLGYRRAETVAIAYRRAKKWLKVGS